MTAPLAGKVALVTGASRGIGRGIALRLAADGARMMVHYARAKDAADEVVQAIRAGGGEADTVAGDIAVLADVARVIDATVDRFGRIDILVNNAGEGIRKPFADIMPDDFDRMFAIARGTFFAMQRAAALMGTGGRIVSISSASVKVCPPDAAIYAGAKAAVETFTRCLAREVGSRGITVNVVAPGATDTDLLRAAPAHIVETAMKGNAFKRVASVSDIADVVAFLASEDARWLTGQVIAADGGL